MFGLFPVGGCCKRVIFYLPLREKPAAVRDDVTRRKDSGSCSRCCPCARWCSEGRLGLSEACAVLRHRRAPALAWGHRAREWWGRGLDQVVGRARIPRCCSACSRASCRDSGGAARSGQAVTQPGGRGASQLAGCSELGGMGEKDPFLTGPLKRSQNPALLAGIEAGSFCGSWRR